MCQFFNEALSRCTLEGWRTILKLTVGKKQLIDRWMVDFVGLRWKTDGLLVPGSFFFFFSSSSSSSSSSSFNGWKFSPSQRPLSYSLFLCFINSSTSSLVLILYSWFSFVGPNILKIFPSKTDSFWIIVSFSTHVSEA